MDEWRDVKGYEGLYRVSNTDVETTDALSVETDVQLEMLQLKTQLLLKRQQLKEVTTNVNA